MRYCSVLDFRKACAVDTGVLLCFVFQATLVLLVQTCHYQVQGFFTIGCGRLQVRDLLTTDHEQRLKAQGQPGPASSLKKDAARVDAIVSTIGFPLVGGPAGEHLSCSTSAGDLLGWQVDQSCSKACGKRRCADTGTMEGGRQADVAKLILTAKNVPYVVAAPLLIQVTILLHWLRQKLGNSVILCLTSVVFSFSSLPGCHDR